MATGKRSIGAVISLEGEAAFRKAVTQCNTALKTMQSEMKLVSEQYKGQANSMEALTAKQKTLTSTLEKATNLQSTLQDALANANDNYAKAGDALEGYRKQLSAAESALSDLQKQQKESGSDEIAAQVDAQTKEVQKLQNMVDRAESSYMRAGSAVETWQQKLNAASADVIKLGRELDDTNRYLAEAESSADGVATSIDGMGRAVSESTQKIKRDAGEASSAVEDVGDSVTGFLAADLIKDYADGVSEAFQSVASAAYEAAREVNGAYDTVAYKTGAAGQDLENYKAIVDGIYADIPADLELIGTAVGEVGRRFDAPTEKIQNLSEQLVKFGKITGEDVSETVRGSNRLLTAFGEGIDEAGTLLDTLTREAQQNGIQIDQVLENTLTNAAAFKSLDLSSSGAVQFMGELMEAGLEAESAVSSLENAYDFTQEKGLDFRDTLFSVNEAIKAGNVITRDGVSVQEFFGDGFAKMTDVVKSGNIDFEQLTKNLQGTADATGYIDDAFASSIDSFDKMDIAMQRVKSAGSNLTSEALDSLAPAVDFLADVLENANEAFEDLPDGVKKTLSVMGLLTVGAGALAPKILAIKAALDALKATKATADGLKAVTDALDAAGDAAEAATSAAKAAENIGDVAQTATKSADGLADVAVAATNAGAAMTTASAGGASLGASLGAMAAKFGPYALAIGGTIAVLTGLNQLTEEHADALIAETDGLQEAMDSASRLTSETESAVNVSRETLTKFTSDVESVAATGKVMEPVVRTVEELAGKTKLTASESDTLASAVNELNAAYPGLSLEVDKATGAFKSNGAAISDLSDYLDQYSKSLEEAAIRNNLQDLTDQKVKNQIQIELNKDAGKELEAQMDALLSEVGMTFEDFRKNANGLTGLSLTFNPNFESKAFSEIYEEYNNLFDATEELINEQEKLNGELDKTKGLMSDTGEEAQTFTDKVKAATSGITGHGEEVDAVVADYAELSYRLQQAGGDVSAVSSALEAEQSRLGPLFAETAGAWQAAYDEIMSGLTAEAGQIATNAQSWQDYRDAVSSSLDSVSSMFTEYQTQDNVTWSAMNASFSSNTEALSTWVQNAQLLLSSARYQNDAAFREIANRILLGGQEAAGYLQSFVENVNLQTTSATDDIRTFAEGLGISEQYENLMTNLQIATEQGLGGVAALYDGVASEAEQSLAILNGKLQEQADIYRTYADSARGLVESERYKTDEDFRSYVNTLLLQGVAGAEQVSQLWQGLQSGSSEVDAAVQSYLSLQEAAGLYAEAWSSVQIATQNGVDGTVSIVDDASGAFGIAAANDSAAIAAGLDNDMMTSAITSATAKVLASLNGEDTASSYYSAGATNAQSYIDGYTEAMNRFDASQSAAAAGRGGQAYADRGGSYRESGSQNVITQTVNFLTKALSAGEIDDLLFNFFRNNL